MNKTAQPAQLNGHQATASIPHSPYNREWFRNIELSDRTAAMLDFVVLALHQDHVQAWELPAPIQGVYFAGVLHGEMRSIEPLKRALAQAEYDRDRYYEQLHNPGKALTDMLQRRIDEAAQRWEHLDSSREFMAHVLDDATKPVGIGGKK